ncbi:MAG: hypothetical protein Q8O67_11230 [Deltaproteobacteria bacterium]|nr:hypothetical protein [Deltaproteobacteria bacterium]
MSEDEKYDRLLERYVDAPPPNSNPEYADVDIIIAPEILAKIEAKHGLSADDVEDIVKGMPPAVVERCHPKDDEKRVFFGFTRHGRDAFVIGVWLPPTTRRRLRIVSTFLPEDDDYIPKYFSKVHR